MKFSSLSVLLCAEVATAAVASASSSNDKRQIGGALEALLKGDKSVLGTLGNGPFGKVKAAPGVKLADRTLKAEPEIAKLGSNVKRVKMRYGPYLVPSMAWKNKYTSHLGMLESYYDPNIEKPCSNCNLLKQVGGLEYADGKNANIDTGLWLHHMVHFNNGPGRWDPVGTRSKSCLPHEGVNTAAGTKPWGRTQINAKNTERYFVTGNERTPFNYWNGNTTAGTAYHLKPQDNFFFLVELMNMNMNNATVYITMDYHYTEGALPSGWSNIKTVFLDANSCGSSEVPSVPGKTQFSISSETKPYKPNVEGPIVDSLGHLHDGGVSIALKAGATDVLCNSIAEYSTKKEFKYDVKLNEKMNKAMNIPQGKEEFVAENHISVMTGCGPKNIQVKRMDKSQSWTTTGVYDYNKRAGNKDGGHYSDVMAIAIVLVASPLDVKALP